MEEIKLHTSVGYIKTISQGINRNTIIIIMCHMYLKQNTLKPYHQMAGTDSEAQFEYSEGRKATL